MTMNAERVLIGDILDGQNRKIKLSEIASKISRNAVFVYPTDTIYGIGGIVNDKVKQRIFSIKKRCPENQMILISTTLRSFDFLKLQMHAAALELADKFWPDKLTLVLPSAVTGSSVAIRLSSHPFVKAISTLIAQPIYSTSANISGEPYIGNPDTIYDTFRFTVDFMIDGGVLPVSQPSSVVSVDSSGSIKILREGAVKASDIRL
jgi:L-threonylcarbamoyladenylate synthase